MAAISTAIIGAAVLGAGATAYASNKAAGAAKSASSAANKRLAAADAKNRELLNPFVQRGNTAGGNLNALLGIGGDPAAAEKAFGQYKDSTGYDFTLQSGADAINTNKAVSGLLQSGSTLKANQQFGQNLGRQFFGDYLGYLGNQQATGVNAANGLAAQGTNIASQQGQNSIGAAGAQGNAWMQTAGAVNNALSDAVGYYGYTQGYNPRASSYTPAPQSGYNPMGYVY
jgi:hypothetical protein